MKLSKKFIYALSATFSLLAVSCAKNVTEGDYFGYNRVLQAWIDVNYPGLSANDSGIFVLNYTQGEGASVADTGYIFVHYYRTDLKGNIASTNIDSLVDQLGNKGVTTYNGSDVWRVDCGAIPSGIEPILKGMRVGGKVLLAVPIKASTVPYSTYSAFNSIETDNTIWYFELDTVVDDIYAYQDRILADFSKKYYGGMDTLSDGFYFKLVGRREGADSLTDEKVHPLRYWGRRIDDNVMFDTNVKDTAKKYNIYSSSSSYDTLGITFYSDLSTMLTNSNYVKGFTLAAHEMFLGDTVDVFFRSDLGYGAAGSGTSIPEYAPLFFRLYTDPDLGVDDDDDE